MPLSKSVEYLPEVDRAPRIPVVVLVAVGAPVLMAFAGLFLFVAAEAAGAHPFAVPPAANVAEAAAYGDAARMLVLMNEGQDPNNRWEVRQGMFDARKSLHVTALEAAILARRAEVATLLLRRGASAGARGEAFACLAQAVSLGRELPPSTFGAVDREYYSGALIEGVQALSRCGLPLD